MLRDKLKKNVARITGPLFTLSQRGTLEYIINQFDELLLQKQNIVKRIALFSKRKALSFVRKEESQRLFSLFKVCTMLVSF